MRFQDIRDMNKEDILASLGLAAKPTTGEWLLGTIGLFGLGVLVGASAALLLAPKAGSEIRQDLGQRFTNIKTKVQERGAQGATENSI